MAKKIFKNVFENPFYAWPPQSAESQRDCLALLLRSYARQTWQAGLAAGIQACTDAIDGLSMLVVAREDVRPAILVQHLVQLAHLRGLPLVLLPAGAAAELAALATGGSRRAPALGFRRGFEGLAELQAQLLPHASLGSGCLLPLPRPKKG